MKQDDIKKFLAGYEDMNRTEGTIQFCRRKLQQLYQDLPADKTIRYGTLKKWQESLLQHGYTPGAVDAFLSAANSCLDYIGYREYQLPEVTVEAVREEKIICNQNKQKQIVTVPACLRCASG